MGSLLPNGFETASVPPALLIASTTACSNSNFVLYQDSSSQESLSLFYGSFARGTLRIAIRCPPLSPRSLLSSPAATPICLHLVGSPCSALSSARERAERGSFAIAFPERGSPVHEAGFKRRGEIDGRREVEWQWCRMLSSGRTRRRHTRAGPDPC